MSKQPETPAPVVDPLSARPHRDDEESSAVRRGYREPLGENALDQLRSYQVLTIPPSARRALMSAELPGASPELFDDTFPPHWKSDHEGPPEAPVHDVPTVAPERRARLRRIVTATAALMLALTVIALLTRWRASSPALPVAPQVPAAPSPRATSSSRAPAPVKDTFTTVVPPTPERHPPSPTKISATAPSGVPIHKPWVHSPPPPASPRAVAPATVSSSATPEGAPRKGFRLGSR